MELRHILSLIGKWAWLIALSVVIAAGSSYFASRAATPMYMTKTTLMVGQVTRNPEASSTDLFTGQQLAFTYSQLARREPVLKGAIESLGLDMPWQALANQVSTNIVAQTQLLEISVIDSNPYRAKALADAIAQQLILQSPAGSPLSNSDEIAFIQEQINELKGKIEAGQEELKRLRQELDTSNSALQIQDLQNQIDLLENKISGWQNTYSQLLLSLQGGDVNVLNVVEEATVPTHPISPNTPMNVLVAAAIGGALALGGILLMEYLDDSIKTPEDIELATGLPTIGTIVKIEGKTYADKLIAKGDPFNPLLEDFRALRNNIQYSTSKKPFRSLLVTSTAPGEGKSLCMANLAVVMATMGQKVILVDSDFRRPSLNEIFGLHNEFGLSTAIQDTDGASVTKYLQDVGVKDLWVLTSGPIPKESPHLLLESERMREVMKEFKDIADVVLFDSPPMLVVSDAATLGTMVDGVLLVVEARNTRAEEVRHVVNEMRRIHIPFIGAVLNRVPRKEKKAYYYNYYSYRYPQEQSKRPSRLRLDGWFSRRRKAAAPAAESARPPAQAEAPSAPAAATPAVETFGVEASLVEAPAAEAPMVETPAAATAAPAPAAPKPDGAGQRQSRAASRARPREGDSKKTAAAKAQPTTLEAPPSASPAEAKEELLQEVKKSLQKKP